MLSEELQGHLDTFYRCSTKEEAFAVLSALTPLDARQVTLRVDERKLPWLAPQEGIWEHFGGTDAPVAALHEAKALYASLKSMLQAANEKAKAAGKPLHIIVGESHCDRNSLLVGLMVMHIAQGLGIRDLGVELFPSDSILSASGTYVHGFERIQRDIARRTTLPPEEDEHSTMPGARRKNCEFEIFLARQTGLTCFSNDLNGEIGYFANREDSEVFTERESVMGNQLAEFADAKTSIVSIYGAGHLEGLRKRVTDNAHTVMIDVMHETDLYRRSDGMPYAKTARADAPLLPLDPEKAKAHADTGSIVFAHVPGKVASASHAWNLANAIFRQQENRVETSKGWERQ